MRKVGILYNVLRTGCGCKGLAEVITSVTNWCTHLQCTFNCLGLRWRGSARI